jgi:hypothetical protein
MTLRLHLAAAWRRAAAVAAMTAVLIVAGSAAGQQPQLDSALPGPRLVSVTPPGAKVGTSVEASFAGADLEEPEKLLFSHAGITAEVVPPPPPPTDPKAPPPDPKVKPSVKFKITVPAEVPVGFYDVRLVNKWGVSNPRTFVVGDQNEILEKEPNNDVPEAQKVEINSTISGSFASAVDVDYYAFAGKKGQRIVFSCLATSIDSRAHPAVELYDAKNHLLVSGRNYQGYDALTDCTLPDDGDYYVRVFEFTHTTQIPGGSTEYFYRLTITTAPWIDAIHPCVLEPGRATQVTIYGRNLPGGQADPAAVEGDRTLEKISATITAPNTPEAISRLTFSGRVAPPAAALDGFEYRVKNDFGSSNPFLLTFARSPVVLDNDANDTVETAQEVPVPCEIAGRIEKRRDRDWYVFNAKKGDTFLIEAFGDRIGAPMLPYFIVRNAEKQTVFESPADNPEVLNPKFFTHSEDPAPYKFTAPADGKFFLLVSSRTADAQYGPRHYYRVRIAPEQPDFQLVVTPSSNYRPDACTLLQGGDESLTVIALRREGFTGDIALSVEGLPPGVSCAPQTVGGGARQAQLVFSAAADAAAFTGEIKVKGTATIKGQAVVREARLGGVVLPSPQPGQPMPLLARLERSLLLAVRDKAPWKAEATIDNAALVQGDPAKGPTAATITVKLNRLWPDLKTPTAVLAIIQELPGTPNVAGTNVTINNNQPVNIAPDQTEAKLPVQVNANVQPGLYTIVLRTSSQVPFNRDPKAPQKQPTNIVLPTTPLALTVVPRVVGTLAVATPNPTLKAGGELPLTIKVTRLFDYAGEFKVVLAPPDAVKDVTAAEVVIPAGKDEATLVLKAPAEAAAGGRNDLVVRATAVVNDKVTTTQEVKFNLNVVK